MKRLLTMSIIHPVKFQTKMPNVVLFQLLICEDLLVLFVIYELFNLSRFS